MTTTTELARNSSRRSDAPRWTEIGISRTPGGYRVEIIGRSTLPGEEDRLRVEDTPSAHVVVQAVAPKLDGVPRLTWVARKTLEEAALLDPDIDYALADFDASHPS